MYEPGWLSLYEAAQEIAQQSGVSWAEALARLRKGCADQRLQSMKAPLDDGNTLPFEFWTRVAPSDWRGHEVDYDGPDADGCKVVVMIYEADFRYWLASTVTPTAKPKRKSRPQTLVLRAIAELGLPDDTPTPALWQAVCTWHADHGSPPPSRDTVLRATGRRKR
jgi:hypothetical protein